MNKKWYWIIGIVVVIVVVGIYISIDRYNQAKEDFEERLKDAIGNDLEGLGEANQRALVTRVIDGDTIEIETGEIVRLICIDTPELGEDNYQEAKDYLEDLILNKEVTLVRDVSDKDRYDRLLRYVFVGQGLTFANVEIARNGWGNVARLPPDTYECDNIEDAQNRAKQQRIGIWYFEARGDPPLSPS